MGMYSVHGEISVAMIIRKVGSVTIPVITNVFLSQAHNNEKRSYPAVAHFTGIAAGMNVFFPEWISFRHPHRNQDSLN